MSRRNTLKVIIVLVSLGVSVSTVRTIYQLWRRQDVLKARETELLKLQEANKTLERMLQDIGSDSYVEQVAREKLGLVKEGETIVILPEIGDGESGARNTQKNITNWKKWWRLFF